MLPKIDKIIEGMQNSVCPSDYWLTPGTEFPELEAAQLVVQHNGQSVWEHTMSIIDLLSIKNPITLLSGLFHDLGKSYIPPVNDSLLPRFPNHALISANIAEIKLTEWQASPYLIDRIVRIILTHMYDIVNIIGEKTIRKFVSMVGQDNIENWFVVRKADSASYSQCNQYRQCIIDSFYNTVQKYLDKLPQKDSPSVSLSKPNIIMSGKKCKDDDIFLSTEGS